MRLFFNCYLETALQLIAVYDGKEPLSQFLKTYFSQYKKHGSKDRKWIAHFCYCYYRLGFALRGVNEKERLLIAIFLCSNQKGEWLFLYDDMWQQNYAENITGRIQFIQSTHAFVITDIFYNNGYLSNEINVADFNMSHLIQPDVFLRLRPGKEEVVKRKLEHQDVSYKAINNACFAFSNTTKVDNIIDLNKEAVIQDASSQQVASLFSLVPALKPLSVWDCCAASGGKSILAYDLFINIHLTVSDIRQSIISNLRERFQQAGIQHYKSFVADVSLPQFSSKQQYDLVICDVPCSGSGTWSRTPEQLCFFTEEKLAHYTQLQKRITANAVKAVKQTGYLLYITCSVFRQENEEMIEYIQSTGKCRLIKAEAIKGYNKKADTLFAALFSRKGD